MKKLLLSFLGLGLVLGVNAQGFVEEFNYGSVGDSLSTIAGSNWVGHSGNANHIQYVTTGLTVSGYTSSTNAGGALTFAQGSGSREDINKLISPAPASGNVYASFILRMTTVAGTSGAYFTHFAQTAGSTGVTTLKARLFIKESSTTAGTFNLGLTKDGAATAAVWSPTDYNANQNYIVVLKYAFSATANDTCYAYVFNGLMPAVEPAPTITISTAEVAKTDLTELASFCVRQSTENTCAGTIDGLRIATSWNNSQLPVKYNDLSATGTDNGNLLKWSTASEKNNSHFNIERSVNGAEYEVIGLVKGAGNTNKVTSYAFTDVQQHAGTTCYRLNQVDFNGVSELSKSVCVTAEKVKQASVNTTPNPFNDKITVAYTTANVSAVTFEVIDMIGKVHYASTEQVKGDHEFNVNTSALPQGVYFIRITNGTEVKTQRIIKK